MRSASSGVPMSPACQISSTSSKNHAARRRTYRSVSDKMSMRFMRNEQKIVLSLRRRALSHPFFVLFRSMRPLRPLPAALRRPRTNAVPAGKGGDGTDAYRRRGLPHSIVAGGFDEMSYTTRFTPRTLLMILVRHVGQELMGQVHPVGGHAVGRGHGRAAPRSPRRCARRP